MNDFKDFNQSFLTLILKKISRISPKKMKFFIVIYPNVTRDLGEKKNSLDRVILFFSLEKQKTQILPSFSICGLKILPRYLSRIYKSYSYRNELKSSYYNSNWLLVLDLFLDFYYLIIRTKKNYIFKKLCTACKTLWINLGQIFPKIGQLHNVHEFLHNQ